MPEEQVDAMIAARAAPAPSASSSAAESGAPVVTLLRELAKRESITDFELVTGDERVVWRRAG
jgi:hypothetical protein